MRYRFVHVLMVMRFLAALLPVFMPVMLVMHVEMGVGEPFVLVTVPVHFPVEEEHAREHDQCSHPILAGRPLTENDDGKKGADEWSGSEPGTGSRRPYFPQGL